MKFEWSLREEILALSHFWWMPILAFLIGGLIGWGVSYLLPANYRAESGMSVAYNGDAIYRNPDDYKNWNLEQLDSLAFAPDVLQKTLNRLRQVDGYWSNISKKNLQKMLTLSWRNTGAWRMTARSDTKEHAAQAAQTWTDAFFETYQQASQAASELFILHQRLSALDNIRAVNLWRNSELLGIQQALESWKSAAENKDATQVLDTSSRWQLMSQVSRAAGFDPAWQSLLQSIPDPQAALSEYFPWLEKVTHSLNGELETLKTQYESLEKDRAESGQKYPKTLEQSRGLSATVIMAKAGDSTPEVAALRTPNQWALVGGLLGVLVWIFVGILRISLRLRK